MNLPNPEKLRGLPVSELARIMKVVGEQLEETKAIQSKIQKIYDFLRLNLIPEGMENEGIRNITYEGIGRVQTATDIRVSVLAADRDELHQWMEDNGHGDMVTDTINSSSLKAWVKGQIKEGKEYPIDLIKVDAFDRASITKT